MDSRQKATSDQAPSLETDSWSKRAQTTAGHEQPSNPDQRLRSSAAQSDESDLIRAVDGIRMG